MKEKLPEWKSIYLAAALETDSTKVVQRIDDAEAAITRRLQESDLVLRAEEAQAMHEAIRALRMLRHDRVGQP